MATCNKRLCVSGLILWDHRLTSNVERISCVYTLFTNNNSIKDLAYSLICGCGTGNIHTYNATLAKTKSELKIQIKERNRQKFNM